MELIIDSSSKELNLILRNIKNIDVSPKIISKHQEHLLPEIENLLISRNKTIKDVSILGVIIGPGSFTGIRLAVATAKALSYVDKSKKIIPINLLDLLGYKVKNEAKKEYCVCIKCTSSKTYVGHFNSKGLKLEQYVILNEDLKDTNDLVEYYSYDEALVGLNVKYKEIILQPKDYVEFLDTQIDSKKFVDYVKLEPMYMALSQAEEELLKKEKLNSR